MKMPSASGGSSTTAVGNKQTTQNSAAARFAAPQYRGAMKRATQDCVIRLGSKPRWHSRSRPRPTAGNVRLPSGRRRGPSPPGAFWRCRSAPGKMRIKPVALIALRRLVGKRRVSQKDKRLFWLVESVWQAIKRGDDPGELPHAHGSGGAPQVDVRRQHLARHRRDRNVARSAQVPRRAPLHRPSQGRPRQDRARTPTSSPPSRGANRCGRASSSALQRRPSR